MKKNCNDTLDLSYKKLIIFSLENGKLDQRFLTLVSMDPILGPESIKIFKKKYSPNLKEIILCNNYLSKFNFKGSETLLNLQIINLQFNNLSKFSWDNFPINLKELDLSWNNLTKFDFEGAQHLLNLQKINLDGNPLSEFSFDNCPPNLQKIHLNYIMYIIKKFDFKECPINIEIHPRDYMSLYENYKKTLPFYKKMAKKLMLITDSILNFHMQAPKENIGANLLQKKGGVLFYQDMGSLKELILN